MDVNLIKFLCENSEKSEGIKVNLTSVFTFIGMAFCIIVALVALVWLTCFIVRLLIKTFKTQVQNSYDIFVENSSAKTASKKERNAIKRAGQDARKMEILKMKEESKDRIHRLKVDKLGIKLNENENKAKEKYGDMKIHEADQKLENEIKSKVRKKPEETKSEKMNETSEDKETREENEGNDE